MDGELERVTVAVALRNWGSQGYRLYTFTEVVWAFPHFSSGA